MQRWIGHCAGVLALATASAALAPERGEATEAPVSDSLVLVLNIISTTHARPATGVVLQAGDSARPALVLVPAQFVSAGDEIIVLDGGTDILRHGRPSRTVARSVDSGVAVLEVEGLQRTGVEVSADLWPPETQAEMNFAGWPDAGDLARGVPLVRRGVSIGPGPDSPSVVIEPALPDLSGPLFNSCGQLAAFQLAGDGGIADASAILRLLDSAGLEVRQSPCSRAVEMDVSENTTRAEPEPEPEVSSDTSDFGPEAGEAVVVPGDGSGAPAPFTPWVAAAVLLGLTAGVVYLRRRTAPGGSRILLETSGDRGRTSMHELRFRPGNSVVRFEYEGWSLTLERRNGAVWVSDRSADSERLKLAVGGTPCLPGEILEVGEGDVIRLGEQKFRLRLALEPPDDEGSSDE